MFNFKLNSSMKYLSIIRYVLIVVSALVVAVPFLIQGNAPEPEVSTMLNWTYALLGVTIFLVIVLPLFNLAKNPRAAIRSLVGIAIVAIVFAIAYFFADDTAIQATATKIYDNKLELKLSDTGLFMTYAAFGITVISIVVTEVYNLFK